MKIVLAVLGVGFSLASTGFAVAPTGDAESSLPALSAHMPLADYLGADGEVDLTLIPVTSPFHDCGVCGECLIPPSGEFGHIAVHAQEGNNREGDGWHEGGTCEAGDCSEHHPYVSSCWAEDDQADVLPYDDVSAQWEELADGTIDLVQLAERYPANVRWNQARHALQVLACDGHVLVHLGLPTA